MEETRQRINEFPGQLVVIRCWCGIQLGVPSSLRHEQERRRDLRLDALTLYCPLGHGFVISGTSKLTELEQQLARKQAALDAARLTTQWTREQLAHTERRRRAEKGAKTRLQRRARAGVCPCCNRQFPNLLAHMSTKHPTFGLADKEEA